ncbi:MAG TPA: ABC-F family ATP-binding cassette domain-containing protein [Actinomycetota bacterium]|nr:ABC-F family ATP-binding cassette domain-containing protein [Actinomycetota bacterium]
MLQVNDVVVEVGGRTVVDGATFTLRPGDVVGLVGRNGAGKTSLLKALAGELPVVSGDVARRGALGYLPQDPRPDPGGRANALAHVVSGRGLDEDAARLEKLRLKIEENPSSRNVARFARAEELYRVAGGYSAEGEARRIAAGLGLASDRLDLPITALSGGERRRVELARILFAGSDTLLLDEPTNHIDTDAKAWLMKFLASFRGALLVVSHDLYLLDQAITRVLHLDESELVEYRGTYSQYRTARRLDEERRARVAARRAKEIRRLGALADSMRHQTQKRARTAKAIDTRVERLRAQADEAPAPQRERRVTVRFPEPPRPGKVVVRVEGLTKGYGGPPVFEDVTFDVGRGERLFVMGLNGAGKTSLLRILVGHSEADAGVVETGAGVSLGYYAQEHEGIHGGVDVLAHLRARSDATDQELRALLGMFGLTGERAWQDAGTLSGGEKTKLALAQLVAGRHNVLLLDEPTNNLDPPSLRAVGDALSAWPGAMVVVSHDRDFVAALRPDRVLTMPEGTLDFWSDDLLDLVSLA